MPATMTQIAKEADVSVAVVSRLLRGDNNLRVSEERRKRILSVSKRLGGPKFRFPSHRPISSLAQNIVIPVNRIFADDWGGKYFISKTLMLSLESFLKSKGFRVSFTFFDNDNLVNEFEKLVEAKDYCDGLVLLDGVNDEGLARLLAKHKFPHVSIDMLAEHKGFNTVSSHPWGGLWQVAEHLKELGHTRIGFFGPRKPRYPFFLAALGKHSLPIDESKYCLIPDFNNLEEEQWRKNAQKVFTDYLNDGCSVTAIVCSNDDLAFLAMDIMREKGLQPGRDLSIIGYDNIEEHSRVHSGPAILTTVEIPKERIGRRCGELLLNQILHRQHHIVHEDIPVRFIARETTGPCEQKEKNGTYNPGNERGEKYEHINKSTVRITRKQ